MQPDSTFAPVISELQTPTSIYNAAAEPQLLTVKVSDPQGLANIDDVNYDLVKAGASSPVRQGSFSDDGADGDVIAKDGIYSELLTSAFAAGDSGQFELTVEARDRDGNNSNVLSAQIFVLSGGGDSTPRIVQVSTPTSVAVDSAHNFTITVLVADPEGLSDIKRVLYQLFPPESTVPVIEDTLTDSGSNGDEVAGDGIYSAQLSSSLIDRFSDYFLRVQVEDKVGNLSSPTVKTIRGRPFVGNAPVIENASVPRITNVTVSPRIVISADVRDPEGLANVDSVFYRLFLPDGTEDAASPGFLQDDGNAAVSGDTTAGDGRFSGIVDLSGRADTTFVLRVVMQANDLNGKRSSQVSRAVVASIDDSPFILNLIAPSLVQIDPTRDQRLLITLDVRDPQGNDDITLAQFRSFLPDGNEANNSPTLLFDTGDNDEGDAVAGDGIYSRFIFLPSQGVTPGDFRFVFEARDQSGARSNLIEHILTVRR